MIPFKRVLSLVFAFILIFGTLISAFTVDVHAAKDKITVMLDPGHAYGDGGGTYAGSHPECYYNMIIALACKEALEAHGGFEVYLSHPDNNTQATLLERAMEADRVNADVIVSLHIDGNFDTNIMGASAMYSVIDKYALSGLARSLLANVTAATGLHSRGTYRRKDTGDGKHIYYWDPVAQWDVPDNTSVGPLSDYYGIITWGAKFGIPAVILEHGFLTHEGDRAIIENEDNLKRMGKADAQAIIDFYTDHAHEWESTRTVDYPTNCVMRGKESYRCRICKARYGTTPSAEDPKTHKHYYIVTDHRDRSCTVTGYTTYTCRIAANLTDKGYDVGQHEYTVYDYTSGHNYVVTEDTQPTHTEDGVHTERCTKCGSIVSNVIPAEGHTWETLTHIPAECEKDGYLHEQCGVCEEEKETVLPALEHAYTTVSNTYPSCTENGYLIQVCNHCQGEYQIERPATGHLMEEKAHTEPTCEEDGAHVMYCSNHCDYETTETLPATGHNYVEDKVLSEPTFFKSGTQRLVCQNDNTHEMTVNIPRTAKTWQLVLLLLGTPLLLLSLTVLLILLLKKKKAAVDAVPVEIDEAPTDTEATAEIDADNAAATEEITVSENSDILPTDVAVAAEVTVSEENAVSAEDTPADIAEVDVIPMEEIDLTEADSVEKAQNEDSTEA